MSFCQNAGVRPHRCDRGGSAFTGHASSEFMTQHGELTAFHSARRPAMIATMAVFIAACVFSFGGGVSLALSASQGYPEDRRDLLQLYGVILALGGVTLWAIGFRIATGSAVSRIRASRFVRLYQARDLGFPFLSAVFAARVNSR